MPPSDEAKVYTKEMQLARAERRYTRKVASPKRWAAIADAKQGPCRVCNAPPPNELHHLVPRAIGGSDTESCIAPLCRDCHALVSAGDKAACAALRRSLTDAEYAYCVETLGEARFESRFPVDWKKVS
jgi:hypothetical protein